MKKYFDIIVTKHDGSKFNNPLKLSEVHLISQLARLNKSLNIEIIEATGEVYKQIFG